MSTPTFFAYRVDANSAPRLHSIIPPLPSEHHIAIAAYPSCTVFGRDPTHAATTHLSHKFASAEHFRVSVNNNSSSGSSSMLVEQLGKNPTFVNGQMLRPESAAAAAAGSKKKPVVSSERVEYPAADAARVLSANPDKEGRHLIVVAVISFPPEIPMQPIVVAATLVKMGSGAAAAAAAGSGATPTKNTSNQNSNLTAVPRGSEQAATGGLSSLPLRRGRNNDDDHDDDDDGGRQHQQQQHHAGGGGGTVLTHFGSHNDMGTMQKNGQDAAAASSATGGDESQSSKKDLPAMLVELAQRQRTGQPLSVAMSMSSRSNSGVGAPTPLVPPNSADSHHHHLASKANTAAGASASQLAMLGSGAPSRTNSNHQQPQHQQQQQQQFIGGGVYDDDDIDMTPPEKKTFPVGSHDHRREQERRRQQYHASSPALSPSAAVWCWKSNTHVPDHVDSAWRNYSAEQSDRIEAAFRAKADRVRLDDREYGIAFCDRDVGMVQYRLDEPSKWRSVKRKGRRDVDRTGVPRVRICYPDGETSDDDDDDDDTSSDGFSSGSDSDSDFSFLTSDDDDETDSESESDSDDDSLDDSDSSDDRRRRRRLQQQQRKKKQQQQQQPRLSPKGKRGATAAARDGVSQESRVTRTQRIEDFADEDDVPFYLRQTQNKDEQRHGDDE